MPDVPVGFYGKLPTHGDFLKRGLSDEFVNVWDLWLQQGLSASQARMGDDWLATYLTSPIWHFVFSPGVVGSGAWAGLMVPSVDRVGRYFPLTVAAALPPGVSPFRFADAGAAWFERIEALALDALQQELMDIDAFASLVTESASLLPAVLPMRRIDAALEGFPRAGSQWRFGTEGEGTIGPCLGDLLHAVARESLEPVAVWWSRGSEVVTSSLLMTRGLPAADCYGDMIDGTWAGGWTRGPDIHADCLTPAIEPAPTAGWSSASGTDIGRHRDENQDGYLECREMGLWAVADGMGGHAEGAYASGLVIEQLSGVSAGASLATASEAVRRALERAHAKLIDRAGREPGFDGGSTVVTLLLRDSQGMAQWVGDSRLYRLRGQAVETLTRDHTPAYENPGADPADAHVISRAVGAGERLDLEETLFEVQPGDRFLLCSDGLYQSLTEAEIAKQLARPDCGEAVVGLLSLALERGGQDNATAVVVQATPGTEQSR